MRIFLALAWPVLLFVLILAAIEFSPHRSPRIRESMADGGPEDPAILAIEQIGGSCFRANEYRGRSDALWFHEVEGNPVVCVCLSQCDDPAPLLRQLTLLPRLQEL